MVSEVPWLGSDENTRYHDHLSSTLRPSIINLVTASVNPKSHTHSHPTISSRLCEVAYPYQGKRSSPVSALSQRSSITKAPALLHVNQILHHLSANAMLQLLDLITNYQKWSKLRADVSLRRFSEGRACRAVKCHKFEPSLASVTIYTYFQGIVFRVRTSDTLKWPALAGGSVNPSR